MKKVKDHFEIISGYLKIIIKWILKALFDGVVVFI